MLTILIIAAAVLLEPHIAHAAPSINDLKFIGKVTAPEIVYRIIRSLFGLAGMAALLSFIYGGFLWSTAQGSDEPVKNAKEIIKNAALGLVVMFFSYATLSYVVDIIAHTTGT